MKNETSQNDLQVKKDQMLDELTAKYIYGGGISIGPVIGPVIGPFPPIQCIICYPACYFLPGLPSLPGLGH